MSPNLRTARRVNMEADVRGVMLGINYRMDSVYRVRTQIVFGIKGICAFNVIKVRSFTMDCVSQTLKLEEYWIFIMPTTQGTQGTQETQETQETQGTQGTQDKVRKTQAINLGKQINKHQLINRLNCFPDNE